MRIVLTGGGTGGHVYPALAIAEALRELKPEVELRFIGTPSGFESKAVPHAGEKFHAICSGGIIGKSILKRLTGACKAAVGVAQSMLLLQRLKPSIVIGTGGFVMAPVLFAARVMGIPYYLQEQNSYPGLSTRRFASKASAVFTAYSQAATHLPSARTILSGNPLRKQMVAVASRAKADRLPVPPRILVTGGSLGARSINCAVAESLEALCQIANVTWQFGRTGIPDSVGPNVARLSRDGRLIAAPFFDDMSNRLQVADLVVCRAGAMTLSEIALFGIPAILVPFPNAAHDHQTANAKSYSQEGAAILIKDSDFSGELLIANCKHIITDTAKYKKMTAAMQSFARPNAAQEIAETILEAA